MISENSCIFMMLKIKEVQTKNAIITEDKVTELFCTAYEFFKFFDTMITKYTIKAIPTVVIAVIP